MPKAYWVYRADVRDDAAYGKYRDANAIAFKKYGARFLVRGGKYENPEGTSRTRNVVIEFESYQKAVDCYNSSEYQNALSIRKPVADADIVIIEGYDGTQPS